MHISRLKIINFVSYDYIIIMSQHSSLHTENYVCGFYPRRLLPVHIQLYLTPIWCVFYHIYCLQVLNDVQKHKRKRKGKENKFCLINIWLKKKERKKNIKENEGEKKLWIMLREIFKIYALHLLNFLFIKY